MDSPLILIIVSAVVAVVLLISIINRYRRCPSDKILVVYGTTGNKGSAKCVHGGGTFVWPIIQDYAYLSLTPISIDANLTNALSRQNIRVDVPCRFTVGISTDTESMTAAAERLLGLTATQIQELARDILFGQLRLVIATMSIEELNSDRDKFLEAISSNVEVELKKIGLRLINVNVTDINDESGYIEALGQEAAAKAVNEAKVRVAEQEKIGEIGKADANRETRIRTAEANAQAVKGENEAKVQIANSDAERREREAEAQRKAIAAEKVAAAKALEEAYSAEEKAEEARANRALTSSSARKSKRNVRSSRLRQKPKEYASTQKVKQTQHTPRWRQRREVSTKSSTARHRVTTRWYRLPAAMPTRHTCSCSLRNFQNSSRLRWKPSRASISTTSLSGIQATQPTEKAAQPISSAA